MAELLLEVLKSFVGGLQVNIVSLPVFGFEVSKVFRVLVHGCGQDAELNNKSLVIFKKSYLIIFSFNQ